MFYKLSLTIFGDLLCFMFSLFFSLFATTYNRHIQISWVGEIQPTILTRLKVTPTTCPVANVSYLSRWIKNIYILQIFCIYLIKICDMQQLPNSNVCSLIYTVQWMNFNTDVLNIFMVLTTTALCGGTQSYHSMRFVSLTAVLALFMLITLADFDI